MKRQGLKKYVVVMTAFVCILAVGCLVSATTFTDSVSFGANSWGYNNGYHAVNFSPNHGFMSKLVSFTFSGMPSNVAPSNTSKIYFKLVKYSNHSVNATGQTSHSCSDFTSWKSSAFKSGVAHPEGTKFTIASKSNESLGATVSVDWQYYN